MFFIFSLVLIAINHKNVIKTDTFLLYILYKKRVLFLSFFVQLLFLGDNVDEESK